MSTARANTNMENTDEKVRMVLQCLNDPNLNDIRLPEGCEIENWQVSKFLLQIELARTRP